MEPGHGQERNSFLRAHNIETFFIVPSHRRKVGPSPRPRWSPPGTRGPSAPCPGLAWAWVDLGPSVGASGGAGGRSAGGPRGCGDTDQPPADLPRAPQPSAQPGTPAVALVGSGCRRERVCNHVAGRSRHLPEAWGADALACDSHAAAWSRGASAHVPLGRVSPQIFPGLILSDIKPAKRMKFKTVCYLLVQLMQCRKMFKAEIPFSSVMTCQDDKVGGRPPARTPLRARPRGPAAEASAGGRRFSGRHPTRRSASSRRELGCGFSMSRAVHACAGVSWVSAGSQVDKLVLNVNGKGKETRIARFS